jgi:hypothetical protein
MEEVALSCIGLHATVGSQYSTRAWCSSCAGGRRPRSGAAPAPRRSAAATTHLAVIATGAKAVADATQATRAARRSISLKVRVSGSDAQSLEHGLTHKCFDRPRK